MTRPQGTTADDIAATRVMRSVLFLAVTFAFGIAQLASDKATQLPLSHVTGGAIAVAVLFLATASILGVHVTSLLRRTLLFVLAALLAWVMAWNIIQGRPSSVLLAYPAGTCFIELWLALFVRSHEES